VLSETSILGNSADVNLRVSVPLTEQIHRFHTPIPQSTESSLQNPDKEQLRADILIMLRRGLSYRKIGALLGIHWTRVGQIVSGEQLMSTD
jgi:hypothetical protein